MKVEKLPWAAGKSHLTVTYAWFLAAWCKVAEVFKTSWDSVFRSVKMEVAWGLEHRDLSGITAIGTDEICWRKRKDKFVTLVYQLDQGKRRLLWIGAIALGCVEDFNNKAKVVTKRSYGFRAYDALKIALYHGLGDLATPKATHRFC